jgi:inorganic phosphate transporter, PiT family
MAQTGKTVLDKDLKKVARLQSAGLGEAALSIKLALAGGFLLVILALSISGIIPSGGSFWIMMAAVIGAYMAMNIGANDVANTMGPTVGSGTLTVMQALILAALCNVAGAVIAGGDVVSTVSKGIIDISVIQSTDVFIWAMIAALLAAAFWVNFATWVSAPVSTTHSIVGGVMGAGIAAAGFAAVNWPVMGKIAASWVISPVLGGVLAAAILYAIKVLILFRDDMIFAARKWVPVFVALMVAIFSVYLLMKGFKRIYKAEPIFLVFVGVAAFFISWGILRPVIAKASDGIENKRGAIAKLFKIPLIFSAGLLAFANGANDVSNAVGPLAGVISAVQSGGIEAKAGAPLWILGIGGAGIAVGIYLFGRKLMQAVGKKITRLNIIRAYAVALSAGTTVIIASALGLPVSSTHVAIGGVFGVGFLREYLANRTSTIAVDLSKFEEGAVLSQDRPPSKKKLKKAQKRKLVRRNYFLTIIAAWIVTVPCAAFLGAFFFFTIRGVMAP